MNKRVGLFGGSFDPIHYGHLAIAEDARLALGLERVIFMPAARQPLKQGQHGAAPEARLAMVRLACAANPAFEVSALEIERAGPSYTITTLEALGAEHGELVLLLGADAAADLPRWRAAERIAALAHLAVIERPGQHFDSGKLLAALPQLSSRLTVLRGPQIAISSTMLRQRAADGFSLRYLTPDPVAEYIRAHQPYSMPIGEDQA
jgi:nicotinate-nucleotide adenylyltransferase